MGSAQNFGFPDLHGFGAGLEKSADEMDVGALQLQITGIGNYLDRVQLRAKV
jgi:hypothetical protein